MLYTRYFPWHACHFCVEKSFCFSKCWNYKKSGIKTPLAEVFNKYEKGTCLKYFKNVDITPIYKRYHGNYQPILTSNFAIIFDKKRKMVRIYVKKNTVNNFKHIDLERSNSIQESIW